MSHSVFSFASSARISSDLSTPRIKTSSMKENVFPDPVTPTSPDTFTRPSWGKLSAAPSSRPNSHHRRRSSVSTRRESAEMMGVSPSTLNDLPSTEEADADSGRRRALWALEGKSSVNNFVNSYSTVEIPELATPETDTRIELPVKNTLQLNSTRRDSFGRIISLSLTPKDTLHTLVEEDEDEETTEETPASNMLDSHTAIINIHTKARGSTPVMINPPPPARPGLKPLTLAMSPPLASGVSVLARPIAASDVPKRRSSLSYKKSDTTSPEVSLSLNNYLPTPELTPVRAERPLSPSESAFLQSNQASLLSRISELERVLAIRTRTMSIATTSSRQLSVSSVSSEPPQDEMLCLIRDLKAERDDLTRDVAVWQTRVEDLEKQISLLTRRVENERRDAWQAREKVATLEIDNQRMQQDLDNAEKEMTRLREVSDAARTAEHDASLRLDAERARCEALERELERQVRVPRFRVENFNSVQSFASSVTDVETVTSNVSAPLKSVLEMEDEDEDELAHYEDEDENDVSTYSDDSFSDNNTGSSFFSPGLLTGNGLNPSTTSMLAPLPSPSSVTSSTPPVTPTPFVHGRKRSMEQAWAFPKGVRTPVREAPEIDRFFACLDLVESSPESPPPFNVSIPSKDKYGFFTSGSEEDEDDLPPFVIPAQTHPVPSVGRPLDAVLEEEDEMEEGHQAGLITPEISPFHLFLSPKRKPVPTCDTYGSNANVFSPTRNQGDAQYATGGFAFGADKVNLTNQYFLDVGRSPSSKSSGSPQTPRKSSIPKPIASPSSKFHPITPNSLPRIKAPGEARWTDNTTKRQSASPSYGTTPTKSGVTRLPYSNAPPAYSTSNSFSKNTAQTEANRHGSTARRVGAQSQLKPRGKLVLL